MCKFLGFYIYIRKRREKVVLKMAMFHKNKIKNNKMSTHQRVLGLAGKKAMKTIFTAHLSRPISRGCSDEFTNADNLKQRMAF